MGIILCFNVCPCHGPETFILAAKCHWSRHKKEEGRRTSTCAEEQRVCLDCFVCCKAHAHDNVRECQRYAAINYSSWLAFAATSTDCPAQLAQHETQTERERERERERQREKKERCLNIRVTLLTGCRINDVTSSQAMPRGDAYMQDSKTIESGLVTPPRQTRLPNTLCDLVTGDAERRCLRSSTPCKTTRQLNPAWSHRPGKHDCRINDVTSSQAMSRGDAYKAVDRARQQDNRIRLGHTALANTTAEYPSLSDKHDCTTRPARPRREKKKETGPHQPSC